MVLLECGLHLQNVLVNVPAGATTGTISVPTTQDNIDEADENFTVSLERLLLGTIVDNDTATV
jgi:hypothetical protein